MTLILDPEEMNKKRIPDVVLKKEPDISLGNDTDPDTGIQHKDFKIEDGVLKDFTGLSDEIELPENIRKIGEFAFANRTSLKEIIISEGVEEIGDGAFYHCSGMNTVQLPNSLKKIGEHAFDGCNDITIECFSGSVASTYASDYNIRCRILGKPDDFEIDADGTLTGYKAHDEHVFIPQNVTKINRCAFMGHDEIVSVTIPKNVSFVGAGAFYNCKKLKEVIIESKEIRVESGAFLGCDDVKVGSETWKFFTPIDVNDVITVTDDFLISNNLLTRYLGKSDHVTIPSFISKIDDLAFGECKSLTEVRIPEGITRINEFAFANCENLRRIIIPKSVAEIDDSSFLGCENLTIWATTNSFACEYSMKHDIPFHAFDEQVIRRDLH